MPIINQTPGWAGALSTILGGVGSYLTAKRQKQVQDQQLQQQNQQLALQTAVAQQNANYQQGELKNRSDETAATVNSKGIEDKQKGAALYEQGYEIDPSGAPVIGPDGAPKMRPETYRPPPVDPKHPLTLKQQADQVMDHLNAMVQAHMAGGKEYEALKDQYSQLRMAEQQANHSAYEAGMLMERKAQDEATRNHWNQTQSQQWKIAQANIQQRIMSGQLRDEEVQAEIGARYAAINAENYRASAAQGAENAREMKREKFTAGENAKYRTPALSNPTALSLKASPIFKSFPSKVQKLTLDDLKAGKSPAQIYQEMVTANPNAPQDKLLQYKTLLGVP